MYDVVHDSVVVPGSRHAALYSQSTICVPSMEVAKSRIGLDHLRRCGPHCSHWNGLHCMGLTSHNDGDGKTVIELYLSFQFTKIDKWFLFFFCFCFLV